MAKRQTNKLKWVAKLVSIHEVKNLNTDRIEIKYVDIREIHYNNVGVTAYDKFTTRDTNEIVKKIEIRIDRTLEASQKDYRIRVGSTIYDIERIYVREQDGIMEVSLAHVL